MGWVIYKKTWDPNGKMLPRWTKSLIFASLMGKLERMDMHKLFPDRHKYAWQAHSHPYNAHIYIQKQMSNHN